MRWSVWGQRARRRRRRRRQRHAHHCWAVRPPMQRLRWARTRTARSGAASASTSSCSATQVALFICFLLARLPVGCIGTTVANLLNRTTEQERENVNFCRPAGIHSTWLRACPGRLHGHHRRHDVLRQGQGRRPAVHQVLAKPLSTVPGLLISCDALARSCRASHLVSAGLMLIHFFLKVTWFGGAKI